MLELKNTNHSYYCSDSNFYVSGDPNHGRQDYNSWANFKEEWLNTDNSIDDDLNHIFRFDITESEENSERFDLWMFIMLQRKGAFIPIRVKGITSENMPEIERFLKARWEYMKNQWCEFSHDS